MRQLLRLISVRYSRVAWGRSLLTLFGITLGVAVVFAIDVVNTSVIQSFRGTIDKVAGKTALTVGAGTGVEEELLDIVRAVPGVAAVAPMIEQSTWDDKTKTQLMVLGVDTVTDSQVRDYEVHTDDVHIADQLAFLNNPHAVIVTTRFAQRVGVKVGDTLRLGTVEGKADFSIQGTLAARGPATVFGGDLLLMDVYAAQLAFGRGKRFDHLDIVPDEGVTVDTLKERIEHAVGGKASVTRPQRRSQEAERLMAGFRLGLSLISLVAIFVGGFVVYNALAIAVAQRRHEIGVWRALGATRVHMLCLFLGEGLIMGVLGSLAGIGFGMLLARAVVQTVSGTISAVYLHMQLDQLSFSARDLVTATSVGVVSSGIAAFIPARRAAFVEPSSVMRKQSAGESAAFASNRTSLRTACAAWLLVALMAGFAHIRHDFMLGYAVSAVFALAVGFSAPSFGALIGKVARSLTRRAPPDVILGVVSFMRNAGRNSVAIAAFGIGLANVVNTDTFVGSMKYSTARWFDRAARADLNVFVGQQVQGYVAHPLPQSVGHELEQFAGVAFVDPFRMTQQSLDGRPFKLAAHDLARYREYNDFAVVQGDLDRALPKITAGTALAASEAFVHNFGLHVGDRVTLQTAAGPHSFEIALIYVDYTSDLGILMTTRSVYTRLWNDTLVDTFSVYLKPGVASDQVRERISAALSPRHGLLVLSNAQYRASYLSFIDRSFALMRGTEVVAIIVAVLGIITTLLVSVMDRRTEIGVLKAIGADAKQVQRMLITEASLIGLASSIIGVSCGAMSSAYIVHELLLFQVGWAMSWRISAWVIVEAVALGQFVTVFAAWWPVRSARGVAPAEALQYE